MNSPQPGVRPWERSTRTVRAAACRSVATRRGAGRTPTAPAAPCTAVIATPTADSRFPTDLPNKPYPSIEGLKNMQSVYKWRAITQPKPEDFVDASFVTELDKSGYIDGLYKQANAAAPAK